MLKTLLWVAIILLIYFVMKRFGSGLVVAGVLLGSIFLSIFMLDTFTTFEVRKYIPIAFYDKTIENPKEVATGIKEQVVVVGTSSVDKVNEVGDNADIKYGTGLDESKEEGTVNPRDNVKEEKKERKEKGLEKVKKESVSGEIFIKYKDIETELETTYIGMTERDKSIVETMMPMLTIKYVGDDYEIWNIRGDEGIYIKRID